MKSFNQLERIIRMDKRITENTTGTPSEFASNIGVSRSHLYRILEFLKDKGAPIVYCRKQGSFVYKEPFTVHSLFTEILEKYEQKQPLKH